MGETIRMFDFLGAFEYEFERRSHMAYGNS